MFDAKIDMIINRFSQEVSRMAGQVSGKVEAVGDTWTDKFEALSTEVKMAIAISLGLSLVDTILLFAILKKLG